MFSARDMKDFESFVDFILNSVGTLLSVFRMKDPRIQDLELCSTYIGLLGEKLNFHISSNDKKN